MRTLLHLGDCSSWRQWTLECLRSFRIRLAFYFVLVGWLHQRSTDWATHYPLIDGIDSDFSFLGELTLYVGDSRSWFCWQRWRLALLPHQSCSFVVCSPEIPFLCCLSRKNCFTRQAMRYLKCCLPEGGSSWKSLSSDFDGKRRHATFYCCYSTTLLYLVFVGYHSDFLSLA